MAQSESNFRIADACCELGYYDAAANRAYYAVVHAQAAILVAVGRPGLVAPYLDKEALNAAFEQVRRSEAEFHNIVNPYTRSRLARVKADYKDEQVSETSIRTVMALVRPFLVSARVRVERG